MSCYKVCTWINMQFWHQKQVEFYSHRSARYGLLSPKAWSWLPFARKFPFIFQWHSTQSRFHKKRSFLIHLSCTALTSAPLNTSKMNFGLQAKYVISIILNRREQIPAATLQTWWKSLPERLRLCSSQLNISHAWFCQERPSGVNHTCISPDWWPSVVTNTRGSRRQLICVWN